VAISGCEWWALLSLVRRQVLVATDRITVLGPEEFGARQERPADALSQPS